MSYSEELIETLGKMKYFIETVTTEVDDLNKRKNKLENDKEDTEHLLQIGRCDAKGIVILGKKIQEIRIEREILRREMLILASLHKLVTTDKGVLKTKITQLEQNTKNTQNAQNNKHYKIRSLDKNFVLSVIKNKEVLKSIKF